MEPNFVVWRTYWSKEINLQASPSTCSPLCCVFSGRAASGSQKTDAGSPRICSFLGTCVALLCQSDTLAFCFMGWEAPSGRGRNTQPIGWHFIYIHIPCWIILKNPKWPWHSFSLCTWLQFKIWIAVYAGRLNTQSAVFELKLYCSLMEMPVSSVSSLL